MSHDDEDEGKEEKEESEEEVEDDNDEEEDDEDEEEDEGGFKGFVRRLLGDDDDDDDDTDDDNIVRHPYLEASGYDNAARLHLRLVRKIEDRTIFRWRMTTYGFDSLYLERDPGSQRIAYLNINASWRQEGLLRKQLPPEIAVFDHLKTLLLNGVVWFCPNSLKYLTKLQRLRLFCLRDEEDNENMTNFPEGYCRLDQMPIYSIWPALHSLSIHDPLTICPARLLAVLPATLKEFEVVMGPGEDQNQPSSRRRGAWIENLIKPTFPDTVDSNGSGHQPGSFRTNLRILRLEGLGLDDNDIRNLVNSALQRTKLISDESMNNEGLNISGCNPLPSSKSPGALFPNLVFLSLPFNNFTSLDLCHRGLDHTGGLENGIAASPSGMQKTRLITLNFGYKNFSIKTRDLARFLEAFPEFRIGDHDCEEFQCGEGVGMGSYVSMRLPHFRLHKEEVKANDAVADTSMLQDDLLLLHFLTINHAGRIITSCNSRSQTNVSSLLLSLLPLVLERAGNLETWDGFHDFDEENWGLLPHLTRQACAANAVYFLLRNGPFLAEVHHSLKGIRSYRKRRPFLDRTCKRKKLGSL
jgi:hypothetical protein